MLLQLLDELPSVLGSKSNLDALLLVVFCSAIAILSLILVLSKVSRLLMLILGRLRRMSISRMLS